MEQPPHPVLTRAERNKLAYEKRKAAALAAAQALLLLERPPSTSSTERSRNQRERERLAQLAVAEALAPTTPTQRSRNKRERERLAQLAVADEHQAQRAAAGRYIAWSRAQVSEPLHTPALLLQYILTCFTPHLY
jgi:hypothetical protein